MKNIWWIYFIGACLVVSVVFVYFIVINNNSIEQSSKLGDYKPLLNNRDNRLENLNNRLSKLENIINRNSDKERLRSSIEPNSEYEEREWRRLFDGLSDQITKLESQMRSIRGNPNTAKEIMSAIEYLDMPEGWRRRLALREKLLREHADEIDFEEKLSDLLLDCQKDEVGGQKWKMKELLDEFSHVYPKWKADLYYGKAHTLDKIDKIKEYYQAVIDSPDTPEKVRYDVMYELANIIGKYRQDPKAVELYQRVIEYCNQNPSDPNLQARAKAAYDKMKKLQSYLIKVQQMKK